MNTLKRRLVLAWSLGLVLFIGARTGHAAQTAKWEWAGIDRIVAIGDIHGTYDKFVSLLRGTGLVDEAMSWKGGDDHLVLAGDLVDRGPDDRKVMELVMRLQNEARAAGGAVH